MLGYALSEAPLAGDDGQESSGFARGDFPAAYAILSQVSAVRADFPAAFAIAVAAPVRADFPAVFAVSAPAAPQPVRADFPAVFAIRDDGAIDATKVPIARIVVFAGNKRVVSFAGSVQKASF